MNKELEEIIKIYATGKHQELNLYLLGKSKDTLISVLTDLLTMYINDKNSSTIREFITVILAGYEHKKGKIGYNGFKQDAYLPGETIKCEAKPKNIRTEEFIKYKEGKRNTAPAKLNGSGNFTDYTWERLERDKQENINMLVSGFIDGKLIYILEFHFNCPQFVKRLEEQLQKWQNKLKGSKTTTGQFLRSANFNYKNFIDCPGLKIVYLLTKSELSQYKPYISKDFYKFLQQNANE